MHILILTSSFPAHERDADAAAGLFVKDFALELAHAGHRVTVLTPAKPASSKTDFAPLTIIRYPWSGVGTRVSYLKLTSLRDLGAMFSLFVNGFWCARKICTTSKVDHVLAMWAIPGGVLARALTWNLKIGYSVWSLGSDINTYGSHPFAKHVVKHVLSHALFRFANSHDLCAKVTRICHKSCEFLPTTRALVSPAPCAEELLTQPRFLYIGRLSHEKGVDVLAHAFVQYKNAGGSGSLTLCGDGPLGKAIASILDKLVESHAVRMRGNVEPSVITTSLFQCDALVIASRSESLPSVYSEALFAGKPVITTDVGDLGYFTRTYATGIVVPPENAEALCAALCSFSVDTIEQYQDGIVRARKVFNLTESALMFVRKVSGVEAP